MDMASSSTTYNYQVCANTGCYIINWFDSFGDGWSDFNGTQGYMSLMLMEILLDTLNKTLRHLVLMEFLLVETCVFLVVWIQLYQL